MPKNYYDDFIKLPMDKMAQSMSDLTYLYQETKVPKKHYKDQLNRGFEEMVESSVSVTLVNTILNTLLALQKESPKLFYQALLCLDTKVKPSSITPSQYQAMEFTWSQFELQKSASIIDKKYIDMFNEIEHSGLTYYMNNLED